METLNRKPQLLEQIGQRIRERRKALGFNLTYLAEVLNMSYQHIQKYEMGKNQITVSRLLQIAEALNVPASYFYEGLNAHTDKITSDVIPRNLCRPLRILLVEDSPEDAMLFSKALENNADKVEMHCISDTEKVLDFLRYYHEKYARNQPDIVVLDLSMPKINGLQLLKQIKSNRDIAIVPIIILTNSISRKEMLEAYSLGASGFIQKSIHILEYKNRIQSMVEYWSEIAVLPTI